MRVLHRAGIFRACLPGKLLSGNQMGAHLMYGSMMGSGRHSYVPCELSLHYPREEKKCPTPTHRLMGTTPNRRLLEPLGETARESSSFYLPQPQLPLVFIAINHGNLSS